MQVFGVLGPDREREAVLDRLVEALTERGRVGVVTDRSPPDLGRGDGTVTVDLGEDRSLRVGPGRSLGTTLDELAVECEYAIVVDRPEADLPQVVVGDAAVADPLATVPEPAALDPATVLAAIEELEPHETLRSLVARAKDSTEEAFAGAIATFTGRVRAKEAPDDDYTTQLEFEKYEGVAEERLAAIREDLESREGVYEALLHHRTGVIEAGEDIVFVVILAGHRSEAFRAVEDGIDRLKEEVPLFKKEVTVAEEFWAHERDATGDAG